VTAKIGTPIRLGSPVDLYPGEWLHSAISRWAWQTFAVSRAALFSAFGLSEVPHSAIIGVGTKLFSEISANISYSTGIAEHRLRGATMESLDERLLFITSGSDVPYATVSKRGPWSRQAGTRYCADCLRDQPGVFKVQWRSPWAFVCMTHRRILLDACPWCQGEIVEMRGRNTDVFDPSTCRANTAPEGSTRRASCRAKLEETWEDLLLIEHSVPMLTQELIYLYAQAGTSMQFIRLLQSAATGLRGAKAFDEIGILSGLDSGELRGLFDEEKHVGISAPKSAYAMAGLIGAACALTRLDEKRANTLIRRATFARPPAHVPRGAGYGPGSPGELLSRWGEPPQPFRTQILRALDQDLTISQRILFDTAVDPIASDAHEPVTRGSRERRVPEQLWPAWCSRLDIGGAVDAATLARALSIAVCNSGALRTSWDPDVRKNLAEFLRPNMLGTSDQTRALLAGIGELARAVDHADQIVDYSMRTGRVQNLLPREHWERLAESINSDPGEHRRHRNATRYLWQRLTGKGLDKLPWHIRIGLTRDDSNEYTVFCTRMTAELQGALDRYGQALLHNQGIWEPVTWAPDVLVDIGWPGPEITDLNVDSLHAMLLDGIVSHRRLAKSLGVTTRQVLRAIDATPPATGRKVSHVDWHELLPPRAPDPAQSLDARYRDDP
jgi:hypothetical protein